MKPEKPKTYTAEFRASAVKLANESDKPITQVAKDLGINVNTLHLDRQIQSANRERSR
jgi:transposase